MRFVQAVAIAAEVASDDAHPSLDGHESAFSQKKQRKIFDLMSSVVATASLDGKQNPRASRTTGRILPNPLYFA